MEEKMKKEVLNKMRTGSNAIGYLVGMSDCKEENEEELKKGPKNYMNKHVSDIEKWKQNIETESESNEDTQRGIEFEDDIIQLFEKKFGYKIIDKQVTYRTKEKFFDRFTIARIDGLVKCDDCEVPLEVKCPRVLYKKPPKAHYSQLQYQMWLKGEDTTFGFYFAVTVKKEEKVLDEDNFLAYKIYRDEKYIKEMKRRILKMVKNYMIGNKIPEINEIFPQWKEELLMEEINSQ